MTPILLQARMDKKTTHLGLYNRVDIGLDPFPYNGATTTCEALWMGVPVVTLLGDLYAGRVGASIMHQVGLDALVAESIEEYVQLAQKLAGDLVKLGACRETLRSRMQESPLMDSEQFTAQLENVYRHMWRKYFERIHGHDTG